MNTFVFLLIIITVIQILLTIVKSRKINHIEHLSQVNELMGYLDRKEFNLTDASGKNAFMIASSSHFYSKNEEFGFEDVVKKGILVGLDINAQNAANGKTALMYALKNKENRQISKMLIEAGADVDIPDASGRLPLFESIKSGILYDEVFRQTSNINHQDEYGVSAFMIAAYMMNFKAIDDLMDRHIDGGLKTVNGQTAYDIAQKHLSRHIRTEIASSQEDEFGKNSTITTSQDVLDAQKHNHKVREAVKKIGCYVNGEAYVAKAFKRPLFKTGKAN